MRKHLLGVLRGVPRCVPNCFRRAVDGLPARTGETSLARQCQTRQTAGRCLDAIGHGKENGRRMIENARGNVRRPAISQRAGFHRKIAERTSVGMVGRVETWVRHPA